MKEVIIATKNQGKAREFEQIFSSRGFVVRTLQDFPNIQDVEETGQTFEENAILKAEAVSKKLNKMVISDDSGLIVDALEGRPGVYSARYAGEQKNDLANVEKVLAEMADVPSERRSARFYCALALAASGQETITVSGTCEGRILEESRGNNGFGYDPIFLPDGFELSMAQLSADEKNKISHRANALKKLNLVLDALLEREA